MDNQGGLHGGGVAVGCGCYHDMNQNNLSRRSMSRPLANQCHSQTAHSAPHAPCFWVSDVGVGCHVETGG